MSSQRVSSSSTSWNYDVFLSYNGKDTGRSFTDHLCVALGQEGFKLFKSDGELERGVPISPEFINAIEESRISLIVFSKGYASSTQCLDELVKIVERMKTRGEMVIIPIFYDVEPSVVRNQIGVFGEAFAQHEETFRETMEKVQMWRNALKEVANIIGFHLKDRYETEFIEGIVKEISSKLSGSTSTPTFMNLKELLVNSCLENLWVQRVPAAIAPPLTHPSLFFFFYSSGCRHADFFQTWNLTVKAITT